ncbi:hypothetical protein CARUB_v10018608mg [Capsella rubella]|uniref:Prolamin-like domain-containing protein n=1 Tax=Capsella rubella TaxID=81985 RepID=R0HMY2_9BRAS|nr:uncharacterized protein LOC17886848 [Capsella rubella]EOA25293.1 hypothetical protein CARUB_v10018608mg [Capsella rubella]
MKLMWATIMLVLIMVLSKSIQTKGDEKANDDPALAPSPALAPQSENGLLPKPISCALDLKTIPNCTEAVRHFKLRNVTKECCKILLTLPGDCFGKLFPIRWIYQSVLTATCFVLGFHK